MKILLLGPPEFTREWREPLAAHEVTVAEALPAKSAAIAACDVAIELWPGPAERKQPLLHTLEKSLSPRALLFSNTVCITGAALAGALADRARLIGLAFMPTFAGAKSMEVCFSPGTPPERREAAKNFFQAIGREMEEVADGVGMVFPRILAMIVNEAFFALQQGVATEEAIDLAMKLATSYPRGPFEWTRELGSANVLSLLDALHAETGDDRYRASTLLRQRARMER